MRRTRVSIAVLIVSTLAISATLFGVLTPAAADPPTSGTVVVEETFTGATIPDRAWSGQGSTCLSGAPAGTSPNPAINNCVAQRTGPVPAIGAVPGYLQLTDSRTNAAGTILYNRPISASAGISVVFDQYQYGGTGADGIGFFLVDGATNLTSPGASGGSLGYAQKTAQDGIVGGYVGIGLDAFGNYYDDGEGRGASCPIGQRSPSSATGAIAPNVVTVRGPGSGRNGYCYQASTTTPTSNPNRPTSTLPGRLRPPAGTTATEIAKRTVSVLVTPAPNPEVVVEIDFGAGFQEVLRTRAPDNPPSTYKFGFTAATGGSTDVHLLRNIIVRTVNPLDALQIVKQVDRSGSPLPAVITAGTTIPYQYVVTNAGLETVNLLAVSDDKVAGIGCAATTLPPAPDPASTTICRGNYVVTTGDVTSGSVTNVARASARDPGGTLVLSAQDSVTVPLVSALEITKAVTTAGPYAVGQSVSYSYAVTNTRGSIVSSIAVKDNRTAAGTVVCDRTTLDPSQVASCSLTTLILAGQLAGDGSLTNTAVATGTTPIGQSVTSNVASARIQVGTDVAVTKVVDNATPVVGENVTFTIVATNNGPGPAQNAVVADRLPTGLALVSVSATAGSYDTATGSWTIPALTLTAPPSPATLTIVATVNGSGALTNAATLTQLRQPDIDPSNNSASVTLNAIVPTTDIAITKSVDQPSIRVGQTAVFTISATNNGPFAATGVTVGDTLPSRLRFVSAGPGFDQASGVWTIGALAVGQTVSLPITVVPLDVGEFQNTAGLQTVSPQDINQSNDVDSAILAVTPALADLQAVKSVTSGVPVRVGDVVTYSVVVTNAGPDAVPDAVLVDTLPAGLTLIDDFDATNPTQGTVDVATLTWSIGALTPGQSASLSIDARVDSTGTKVNVATVSSATVTDPDLSNNSADASFSASPTLVDLAVTKFRSGPAQVALGASVVFTVGIQNNGPVAATNIVVRDQLPPELGVTGATPSVGIYDVRTGLWSIPALANGGTAQIVFTTTATGAGTFLNTATLQSLDQADTDPANNSASASVVVVVVADLVITKTVVPLVAQPGQTVRYTVTVANVGPNGTDDVQAVDPLRIDAQLIGSSASQGTFDPQARVWNIGSLASGASAVLTVDVLITRPGSFLNTVVISQTSVTDPDLSNNRAQAVLEIPAADLSVLKVVDDAAPEVGQEVSFTITASNLGPNTTSSASVQDALPAGLTYVSSVASAGDYDQRTGVWRIGSLDPGGTPAVLTVVAIPSASGALSNIAIINATFPYDPDEANNSSTVTLDVSLAPADLMITKSVAPISVTVGDDATFEIVVENLGPAPAIRVILRDTLPVGLVASGPAPERCAFSGSNLECDLEDIAVGARVVVEVTVTTLVVGDYVNTATVTSDSPDPDPSNDTASTTLAVGAVSSSGAGSGSGHRLPATGADPTWVAGIAGGTVLAGVPLLVWRRPRRLPGSRTS